MYLFLFEKVIGKIGISYFTYRKMQPRHQCHDGNNGNSARVAYVRTLVQQR